MHKCKSSLRPTKSEIRNVSYDSAAIVILLIYHPLSWKTIYYIRTFVLLCRVVVDEAQSTCGPQGTAVQMMTVTVMAMQPVCGPSPLTPLPMMVRRRGTTSPARPPWPPPSATARVDTKMLAW